VIFFNDFYKFNFQYFLKKNKVLNPKNKYISELDSVRAIAALCVMMLHFLPALRSDNVFVLFLKKYHSFFQFGVPIFFVLSGFLISRILLKSKYEDNYFKNFYIKRSLRIFPLYYLICILIFFVFPYFINNSPKVNFNEFWPNLIYLQNIFISFHIPYYGPNHFWSLSVEEHFYLIWPIVIYYLDFNKIKFLIFILLIFQPLLRIILIYQDVDIYYFTFTRLDELLYGCLIAIYEIENKKISKKKLSAVILISIFFLFLFSLFSGSSNIIIQGFKYSFFGFLFFVLVGYVALNNNDNLFLLKSKILVYTGKISYGLYMYHPFVFYFYFTYYSTNYSIVSFIVCFGITYLISTLSYYLVEKPILNLKRYFVPINNL
jgi:peptidoglycan/LPS O-acetylase OafA/YrhL